MASSSSARAFPCEAFRLAQRRDSILIIAGADLQIAQQHGVIGLLWIDGEHFLQKVLRFFRTSHHGVGLRQAGEAEDRRRIQAEPMIVGIQREAGFGVKASRVAEQEPELWIIRSRLSRALCVDDRLLVVAAFQCGFRSAGQAGVLDIRAPAQLALRSLRLAGSRLRLRAVVGSDFVRLRENVSAKKKNDKQKIRQFGGVQVEQSRCHQSVARIHA